MTKLLDRAVAKAKALPPDKQDTLAALLLDEMESDTGWDRRFADSKDLLGRLAAAAMLEAAAGNVTEEDPGGRP